MFERANSAGQVVNQRELSTVLSVRRSEGSPGDRSIPAPDRLMHAIEGTLVRIPFPVDLCGRAFTAFGRGTCRLDALHVRGDETRRGNRSDRSVADERVFCHERNDVVTSSFVILLCDRRIRPPALLGRTIPIPLLRRLLGALTRTQRRILSSRRAVRSCHRGLDRSATWNQSEYVQFFGRSE